MDEEALVEALRDQDGVVSRAHLGELGAAPHDVRRLLRRRELTRVHPGVYVDHTGPLTWPQRAQAAVLAHWPAALTRESALPSPPPAAPIQVAVDHRRTVVRIAGVDAHRTADFEARVLWRRSPPRVRLEHAVLDLAADAADEMAAYRLLADACQSRETSPRRLLTTLGGRLRIARRAWLHDLLTVRLTYGQVLGDPCRTAKRVGAVLQRRGWSGRPSACAECT